MLFGERSGVRHRWTHILESMHVGGAGMSRRKSRGFIGSHGIVLGGLSHSRVVPSRLQQCTARRSNLRVRWQRVQLDMSDEADHVWAGSGESIMIDDVNGRPDSSHNIRLINCLIVSSSGPNESKALPKHTKLSRIVLARC